MTKFDPEVHGELISAYLDGELDQRDTTLVERLLKENPQALRYHDDLRSHSQALRDLPKHSAPAAVLDDLRLRLERAELLDEPEVHTRRIGSHGKGHGRWLAAAMVGGLLISGAWWTWQTSLKSTERAESRIALAPENPTLPVDQRKFDVIAKTSVATTAREPSPPSKEMAKSTAVSEKDYARPMIGNEKKEESTPVVWRSPNEIAQSGIQAPKQRQQSQEEIRTLPFATQELRLQVSVPDEAAKNALVREIVQQVSAQGAKVLTEADFSNGAK
ncbi:MAG: hypothetical protein AABZ47_11855, partial [Planctomycetota bacterium]